MNLMSFPTLPMYELTSIYFLAFFELNFSFSVLFMLVSLYPPGHILQGDARVGFTVHSFGCEIYQECGKLSILALIFWSGNKINNQDLR